MSGPRRSLDTVIRTYHSAIPGCSSHAGQAELDGCIRTRPCPDEMNRYQPGFFRRHVTRRCAIEEDRSGPLLQERVHDLEAHTRERKAVVVGDICRSEIRRFARLNPYERDPVRPRASRRAQLGAASSTFDSID